MLHLLLLLGVGGALGQYTTFPFGLKVPFTGNPIIRDTVPLTTSLLSDPWLKIIKDLKDDKFVKADKIVKPEFEVTYNPLLRSSSLCLTHGIGCPITQYIAIDDKPLMTMEDKCLKMGDCSKDVIDKFKMTDPEKIEWLCKNKGIACMDVRTDLEKCMDMGLGCTSDMLDKIKMDFPEKRDWLCRHKGIGCAMDRLMDKERMCLEKGLECNKEVIDKIRLMEPEKADWLCKMRGLGCIEFRSADDLCTKHGICRIVW